MSILFIFIAFLIGVSLSIFLMNVFLKDEKKYQNNCSDEMIDDLLQSKKELREKIKKIKDEKIK
jgi:hypothetical protein